MVPSVNCASTFPASAARRYHVIAFELGIGCTAEISLAAVEMAEMERSVGLTVLGRLPQQFLAPCGIPHRLITMQMQHAQG